MSAYEIFMASLAAFCLFKAVRVSGRFHANHHFL
jgi:hypothetical protein